MRAAPRPRGRSQGQKLLEGGPHLSRSVSKRKKWARSRRNLEAGPLNQVTPLSEGKKTNMTKRKFQISLITATLVAVGALSGAALARHGGPGEQGAPGQHFIERHDENGDGKVTLDEAVQTAEERFAQADTNSDGNLTLEEGKAAAEARRAERAGKGEQRMKQMFERRDENGDGKLQRSEVERMPSHIFDAIDTNGDKALTADEMKTHFQAKMAQRGERHFKKMDVTGDGKVSVHEAIDAAKLRFEQIDENGDEVVTAEEAASARPPHARGPRAERGAHCEGGERKAGQAGGKRGSGAPAK